ncbi:MAG: FAD-dependent oxidoreductase [Acidimicrobiales bacterium]|nr:FAD-dependent oxidoreductase [Acidimicrobiales bacterium]
MSTQQTFVIVGASLAGAKAAETLRTEGFDGRVVLVGAETVRPYERPPLSKAYLRGEVDFEKAAVHPEGFYEDHGIELITSTMATSINPAVKKVDLDSGGSLDYDQLLLTTGATPRHIGVPGAELDGVHYLRSLSSCDSLKEALAPAERLVVVGAGWIGSEVAASARQLGKEVALVESGQVPLERVLGTEVGAIFRDLHADRGVELHMGSGVQAFRGSTAAEAVELTDGSVVSGDVFVVGIGVEPSTELARVGRLQLDNGIVVDEHLATSASGIWAAGDVANAYHPVFGCRIRLEHWSAALNQGPVAAKNMLGQGVTYEKIPYFFSDQYDLGMEYNGFAARWDQIVYRGDRASGEVVVFWLDGGVPVAGMNLNVWDVAGPIADLVGARRPVDPVRLADPDVDLASLGGPSESVSKEK